MKTKRTRSQKIDLIQKSIIILGAMYFLVLTAISVIQKL